MRKVDSLLEIGHAAALCTRLKDALGAVDGVGQLLTVFNGEPAGLLAVHVLAGFCGQDGSGGVPAISSGDQHGINVRAIQYRAEVAHHG